MNELDHINVELAGTNLIEASAGTGKTYAIACLYLRLLVELDLTPEKILVVTYTEAATEELRGRVRARIRETLELFEGGVTDDDFLRGLLENTNGRGPETAVARERLDRALKSFDQASIFTIHGFCLRALQDNAFESGSLYDTELLTDQRELLREVVDDFWRQRFFTDPAPLLGYALRKGLTPDYFMDFLKGLLGDPKLTILPELDPAGVEKLESRVEAAFVEVKGAWQQHHDEIRELLETSKALSRAQDAYKAELLPAILEGMDRFVAGNDPYDLSADFAKLTTAGIAKGTKGKSTPPEHPFFLVCDRLHSAVSERFLALRSELISFARERLPELKRQRNVRCFDDLLTSLYDGLHGGRGDDLAESLRNRYCAALIDEFQDTDPVQFDIFRRIYGDSGLPLFLIGDPKQAIYSFRGADIFAYLEASRDVEAERRFTLTRNWRSAPRLLDAFNLVYRNGDNPFVFEEIQFHAAQAGKADQASALTVPEGEEAPLKIWHLPVDENGKEATVTQAGQRIPGAVAAEIARLLAAGRESELSIGDKPLLPEHIAVIVRKHDQGGQVQEALRRLGIPSVVRSDKSIFTTREAVEVCTVLNAVAAPGNESKLRAALVTDLLGLNGDDIHELLEDEPAWEAWLEKFREYHQLWLEKGFMVMARALLASEGVRGRLLARPDGERSLTNILHCFEILHKASQERGLGAEGLVTWLGERISAQDRHEEYQIRLETDEKAVKILTIHVSKGLEYPIVFCPYHWAGLREPDEVIAYHDGYRLTKDFGSSQRASRVAAAQKESLAEELRLLYVALTRAKYRCYLVGGKISGAAKNRPETSPISYLLHASEGARGAKEPVGVLAGEVKKLSAAEVLEQLEELAAQDEGTISIDPLPGDEIAEGYRPEQDRPVVYRCRDFDRAIDREWRISSFTSLAAHDQAPHELPERDQTVGDDPTAAPAPVRPDGQQKNIFTFPRGASAGIFLHEIFEKLDFAGCNGEKAAGLVGACLEGHNIDPEWAPSIRDMVDHVVSTPLSAPEGSFTLADLRPGRWLTELEFFFPLKFVTSATLREFFKKWSGVEGCSDLLHLCQSLRFRPVKGMVKGFMDLVFEHGGRYYLADWKSNHLGYRAEDYHRDALQGAMAQHMYTLQYLLYTVALNRYLSLRVPGYRYDTHFGGVLYIFLRGAAKEQGERYGIFRDLPPAAMIDELTGCLIQAGG
ncbi:exodeoxyribonuclease V subunit beta [Geomonas sp. Red32]|uniref:exodeoxyribonuclease V subunit beta n=1 Tax=Geomonas sp. Red32 TaxID=2912856 RepID=UPI00202D0AA6|nr:exodeoxyribonuclease V subunit beta [Geomonas sp. Red32]MCM0083531.1 exodeoxyribonuclease V subunit beta [Geomonas sp. Red32]